MNTRERDQFEWAADACEATIEGPAMELVQGEQIVFESSGYRLHVEVERLFLTHAVAFVIASEHPAVHAGNRVAFANGPES